MHACICAGSVSGVSNHYNWADYLRALNMSQADLAARGGVSQPTVSRWLKGEVTPDAKQVIALARAAQHSPIGALIAAGYLDEDEVGGGVEIPVDLHLRLYTDRALLLEVLRRVDSNEPHDALERPLDGHHPVVRENELRALALQEAEQEANRARTEGRAPSWADDGDDADVGVPSENQLRQRGHDLAANRDKSADRLDPDTQ